MAPFNAKRSLRRRSFRFSIIVILFHTVLRCESFQCLTPVRPVRISHANTRTTSAPWIIAPSLSSSGNDRRHFVLATTKLNADARDYSKETSIVQKAIAKFKSRPGTFLLIPCVAALVGWFTNWLAVQMIFYPIKFVGIPIYTRPEMPLGFLGWQGIIPCKTRPMSTAMVHMVSTQLLTVREAFARLDPANVAKLLAPEVPTLSTEILADVLPRRWMVSLPTALFGGLDNVNKAILHHYNFKFLEQFARSMQVNIDAVFNLQNCVVTQMLQDRSMLGQLFRSCGQQELNFLTNSGLWFGFLLGLVQMLVALVWDNPWTLSIGGGIVGLATNWLALKWIFEPVEPLKVGPFVLQGMFLRRQKEVAVEFSKFFANKILTAEQLWKSVLTDPVTKPAFASLFASHFQSFLNKITRGFRIAIEPEVLNLATSKAIAKLPEHLPVLYSYMDKTLALEETLRVRMMKMTSRQFERVLHPIFEEDELTLIIAGAVLGFAAGLIQQGFETGSIKIPNVWTPVKSGVGMFFNVLRKQIQSARNHGAWMVYSSKQRLRNLIILFTSFARNEDDDNLRNEEAPEDDAAL
jgi:uncharacterized membrane protein YheB (UPF0754 family)